MMKTIYFNTAFVSLQYKNSKYFFKKIYDWVGPIFLHPLSMKIKSIYRWWNRDTFSLLVQNLSPWFDPKASQSLAQSSNDELSVLQEKWLVGLATLGRCHRLCSLDQPERLRLACSQVSQDCFLVRCIQFGEETRCQMPWECGHPTSLAGEEGE